EGGCFRSMTGLMGRTDLKPIHRVTVVAFVIFTYERVWKLCQQIPAEALLGRIGHITPEIPVEEHAAGVARRQDATDVTRACGRPRSLGGTLAPEMKHPRILRQDDRILRKLGDAASGECDIGSCCPGFLPDRAHERHIPEKLDQEDGDTKAW